MYCDGSCKWHALAGAAQRQEIFNSSCEGYSSGTHPSVTAQITHGESGQYYSVLMPPLHTRRMRKCRCCNQENLPHKLRHKNTQLKLINLANNSFSGLVCCAMFCTNRPCIFLHQAGLIFTIIEGMHARKWPLPLCVYSDCG